MEGSSILIPNSVASRDRLEVFRRGGVPIARVLHLGLEYETTPARARVALEDALRDLPGLVPHPAPTAGDPELRPVRDQLRGALLAGGLRALSRDRREGPRAGLVPPQPREAPLRLPGHPPAPVRRGTAAQAGGVGRRSRTSSRGPTCSPRSPRTSASGWRRAHARTATRRARSSCARANDVVDVPDRGGALRGLGAGRRPFQSAGRGPRGGLRVRRDQPPDRRAPHRHRPRADRGRRWSRSTRRRSRRSSRRARPWSRSSRPSSSSGGARRRTGSRARMARTPCSSPKSLRSRIARFFGLAH